MPCTIYANLVQALSLAMAKDGPMDDTVLYWFDPHILNLLDPKCQKVTHANC